MTVCYEDADLAVKNEIAEYVGMGSGYPTGSGLPELHELLTYLDDTYPEDEVIQALTQGAWDAVSKLRT